MSTGNWERVRSIFEEALPLGEPDRARLLEVKCGGDSALRKEVESLLLHAQGQSGFLERPAVQLTTPLEELVPGVQEKPGDQIGPYRLVCILGQGTYGTVWRAQREADFAYTVAIKIIRPGMDSATVITRFEQERQALASMDHPCISRVFDGGVTPRGRPYFVMELVDGLPITDFADREGLDLAARLELFRSVCEAVQHAHSKGIIHRDLKPGNILVVRTSSQPMPKVIDFGIAKSVEPIRGTLFTAHGQPMGTLEYMSPEQASGGTIDIDTRTDVYGLGVVLYQLLTGKLPFDSRTLRDVAPPEQQRIIREVEPSKPSTRALEADEDPADPRVHRIQSRHLRGDLDWIVMKCLEKDRSRRYTTASAIAEELNRVLRAEPVLAGPPSAAYRLKKFVRRRRGPVAAAALVLLTLTGGLVGTLGWAGEASRQRDEAQQSRDESAAIIEFVGEVFMARGGETVDVRKSLADASLAAEARFRERPDVEAGVRSLLGAMFESLGDYDLAREQLTRALELRRRLERVRAIRTADAIIELGSLCRQQARFDEADALFEEAIAIRKRDLGRSHWGTIRAMVNLAQNKYARGGPQGLEEAEKILRDCLSRVPASATDPRVWGIKAELGTVLAEQQRLDEAEELLTPVFEFQKRTLGESNARTLETMRQLGQLRLQQRRWEAAEEIYNRLIPLAKEKLGAHHPTYAACLDGLARLYSETNRLDQAIDTMGEAVAIQAAVMDADHIDRAIAESNLAELLVKAEKFAEAEPLYLHAYEIAAAKEVEWSMQLAGKLADLYAKMERPDEAVLWASRGAPAPPPEGNTAKPPPP